VTHATESPVISKVLVLDDGTGNEKLRKFCEECGLVGIKPQFSEVFNVMLILNANVDLGGILLYERFSGEGLDLAREIRASRPELPIFLRRDTRAGFDGLSAEDAAMFRGVFTLDDLEPLRSRLDESIFGRVYPNALVRGINEMTLSALQTLFRNCDIAVDPPSLVKDRIIYGEVFSLIAIEAQWCRGYMMFQAPSKALLEIIRHAAGGDDELITFRDLNNVLGEATNLVWGAFKNRYVGHNEVRNSLVQTQVPIIVNHEERYISFGSDDPQLCLRFLLRDRSRPGSEPVVVMQRFIFNLNWSPEDFAENEMLDTFLDSGELEMF